MSRAWAVGLLLLALVCTPDVEAGPRLKNFCKKSILALALVSAVAVPDVYHNLNARTEGVTHIGHGIYLDMDEVRAELTDSERELLLDPETNRDAIVHLFMGKLSGGYDYTMGASVGLFPNQSRAVDYFRGHGDVRGICRHKASILCAILNRVGIRAWLETGMLNDGIMHVWVYLPDIDYIADPTSGEFMPAQEYRKENVSWSVKMRLLPRGWF